MPATEVKQSTAAPSHGIKFPYTQKLSSSIVKWIDVNLTSSPEFAQFQRKRLEYTMFDPPHEGLAAFTLSPEITKQHAVVTGFIGIRLAHRTLSQCE
jgi:hypothetical protein